MLEKLELLRTDGSKISADLISKFEININNTNRKYILYTTNEIDQNGLIRIQASEIVEGKLIKIASDEEWDAVKNVMRAIISASKGDFKYLAPEELTFNIDEEYSRVISVQDVAKDALVKDYEEKKPQTEDNLTNNSNKEDPNAVIYPTENTSIPIGTEVTPGINEVPSAIQINDTDPTVNMSAVIEPTPIPNIEPTPQINEPNVLQQTMNQPTTPEINPTPKNSNNNARDILIQDITAAVDKYLANLKQENPELNNLKSKVSAMQAQLQALNDALNTQE